METSTFFKVLDGLRNNEFRWDQGPSGIRNIIIRNNPRDPVDWVVHQRPDQMFNLEADTIVRVCGRGAGKSLSCSHNTRELFDKAGYKRGLIIAPTDGMVRDTNILGDDGVVNCSRNITPDNFKTERGGRHTLNYPNGAKLFVGSAASPRSVRGRSVQFLELDEFAFYDDLDQVFAAVLPTRRPRIGEKPTKLIVTTTPNMDNPEANMRLQEWKDAADEGDPTIDFIQIPSEVNRAISASTHKQNRKDFLGSELLRRQEFDAEIILDEGKAILFKNWMFQRGTQNLTEYQIDLTIGFVDPAMTSKSVSDYSGICIAARTNKNEIIIMHTEEDHYSPKELNARMMELHEIYKPDLWRGEANGVGEFFEEAVDVPNFDTVYASRDSRMRAMQVLGLFEQLRVILLGGIPKHEMFVREACGFTGVDKLNLTPHDDAVSAVVHCVRELFATPVIEVGDPVLLA